MRTTLALLAPALLLACAPQTGPNGGVAPAAVALTPVAEGVTRFRMGALELTSFQDLTNSFPNDGSIVAIDTPLPEVKAVLAAAGAPTEQLRLDVNVLLVRAGERTILIDSGSGTALGKPGELPARLAAAGVRPEAITDILISHTHSDHTGGLVSGGRLAFPSARIHIAADEWTYLQGQTQQRALADVIRPRVATFRPGATLAPGVRTVAVEGHTPGHVAAEISGGGQRLLAIGDTVHHHVISVRKPEWTIRFDGDAPTAERSRRALLAAAAREGTLLFVPHFPAPGVGTVRVEGDGFAWVPLAG